MNVHRLRAQSAAVFLVTEEGSAKELSESLVWAADKIEQLRAALTEIFQLNMPTDKNIYLQQVQRIAGAAIQQSPAPKED